MQPHRPRGTQVGVAWWWSGVPSRHVGWGGRGGARCEGMDQGGDEAKGAERKVGAEGGRGRAGRMDETMPCVHCLSHPAWGMAPGGALTPPPGTPRTSGGPLSLLGGRPAHTHDTGTQTPARHSTPARGKGRLYLPSERAPHRLAWHAALHWGGGARGLPRGAMLRGAT